MGLSLMWFKLVNLKFKNLALIFLNLDWRYYLLLEGSTFSKSNFDVFHYVSKIVEVLSWLFKSDGQEYRLMSI